MSPLEAVLGNHLDNNNRNTGDYSPESLQSIADACRIWNQKYPETNRVEKQLSHEFRLLIQYMIINQVRNPLNPPSIWVERWMKPAEGLDIYDLRLKVFERLTQELHLPYPKSLPPAPQNVKYPAESHLKNWRAYYREIFLRSRSTMSEITTEKIVQVENRTWPYYKAMSLVDPKDQTEKPINQVHLASHNHLTELLKKIIPPREDGKYRILEFACGDGGLLLALRKTFPKAELIATNLSGDTGLLEEVKKDKNITIITDIVENTNLEENSFDAVVSTEVIEHLVHPKEMVRQTFRLLKLGGAFIMTAPSVHCAYLSNNPMTYFWSLLSTVYEKALPPFHNLWEPLTDLHLIHYAFSYREYREIFAFYFPQTSVSSLRFTHLKKFKMDKIAPHLPILKRWGGLLLASGNKLESHI